MSCSTAVFLSFLNSPLGSVTPLSFCFSAFSPNIYIYIYIIFVCVEFQVSGDFLTSSSIVSALYVFIHICMLCIYMYQRFLLMKYVSKSGDSSIFVFLRSCLNWSVCVSNYYVIGICLGIWEKRCWDHLFMLIFEEWQTDLFFNGFIWLIKRIFVYDVLWILIWIYKSDR